MDKELLESLNNAKRACGRSCLQKMLPRHEDHKTVARNAATKAHLFLKNSFDNNRKRDETTFEQIQVMREAKDLCRDALDSCATCDMERPLMKDMLSRIKTE